MTSLRIFVLRAGEYIVDVLRASETRQCLQTTVDFAHRLKLPFASLYSAMRRRNTCTQQLGANYDTDWARRPVITAARSILIDTVGNFIVTLATTTTVLNREVLDEIEPPVIFVANHSSHFDTTLMLTALPKRYRHHSIIAAGADYWFDSKWKARFAAFAFNIIPIEREKVDRKSADKAARLLRKGWNVIIYPEGTRSRDGFARPFRGGAAYLSIRCNVPVVPVHIEGTRTVFGVGASHATPGPTRIVFGAPIYPQPHERSRDMNPRIERAVSAAADEGRTDWWSARRRAQKGDTPPIQGPPGLHGWRRNWLGSARVVNDSDHNWPRV